MNSPLSAQSLAFLLSVGFGAALGLLYELFRVLRRRSSARLWPILLQDVLFFALCAFASLSFLHVVYEGQARFYFFLGGMFGLSL